MNFSVFKEVRDLEHRVDLTPTGVLALVVRFLANLGFFVADIPQFSIIGYNPLQENGNMNRTKFDHIVKTARENGQIPDLSRADLFQINLSRTKLAGIILSGANLKGAYLVEADLKKAKLDNARLSSAYMNQADLSDADLHGADLSGATLTQSNLRGADLSKADLTNANLYGANLEGANLLKAQSDNETTWPDGYDPVAAGVVIVLY